MRKARFTEGADRLGDPPGGARHAGGGALPQDGDQRTDLLHVEEAVRRELGASELKRVRQRLREPARLTLWRDGCGLPGDGLNLVRNG